jgi:hypothetical protein
MTATVPPGGDCGGRPCWRAQRSRVFKYANKTGAADGIRRITLVSGADSRAAIKISAAGANLDLPAAVAAVRFFDQDTRITVQLVANLPNGGRCWSAEYAAPARANKSTVFNDKAP